MRQEFLTKDGFFEFDFILELILGFGLGLGLGLGAVFYTEVADPL